MNTNGWRWAHPNTFEYFSDGYILVSYEIVGFQMQSGRNFYLKLIYF